ncbi:hypothetical protein ARAM_004667 [Aspergillus rambellii]|uniref:Uncharacterized protein n=1 Tax=Aspergillus rambellii TaxID=308745 RepID=A0A0F8VDQ4_9EURO|nr:hypothetical protein ARAM_004667 [Aspergillus rambellii]
MDQFLHSIKDRGFVDVILGFGTSVSLVTVLVDMDAAGWAGLLGIRGMISRDRAPGVRCVAFDNLLRRSAKQNLVSEVYVLRSFGADVGAKYDSLTWWPKLEEGHENMSPLCLAAEAGPSDVVALLLADHANIEARGHTAMTPLIFAARGGNVTTVQVLLHRGADIEAKDDNQRTALSHAAQGGHIEVVELLLNYGADMETLDADGKSPLHYTVPFGHLPVFNLMLRVGAYRQMHMQ